VYIRHGADSEWWFTRRGKWGMDFDEALSFETYIEGLAFCRSMGLNAHVTGVFNDGSAHYDMDVSALRNVLAATS
jgi:hypothetical protein